MDYAWITIDYDELCIGCAWTMHRYVIDYAWIMHELCIGDAWIMHGL
jgi:hypothetical protein